MSTPSDQKGRGESKPATRRSSSEMLRTGGLIALAVVATLFALLNLDEVKVDWIIGSGHAPLIIVIAVSVLAGIVLTYGAERVNRKRR
jgi:uncharacterized integral membrane protein